jgi:hypothetical protein
MCHLGSDVDDYRPPYSKREDVKSECFKCTMAELHCIQCVRNQDVKDFYFSNCAPAPQEAQTDRICVNCLVFDSCKDKEHMNGCDNFWTRTLHPAPASSAGEVKP